MKKNLNFIATSEDAKCPPKVDISSERSRNKGSTQCRWARPSGTFINKFFQSIRRTFFGGRGSAHKRRIKRQSFSYFAFGLAILILATVFVSLVSSANASRKSALGPDLIVVEKMEQKEQVKQINEEEIVVEPAVKTLVDSSAVADPNILGSNEVLAEVETFDVNGVPKLTASAAVVRELDVSAPILNQSPEARWPLASLTKLMTATVALEKLGAENTVVITDEAIAIEGVAGDFKRGEEFLVRDIIKIMMTVSSNDGAEALKIAYDAKIASTLDGRINSEGESSFIKEMRLKAAELDMKDTTFNDASGLSVVNQSTLSDIEKLARYVLSRYPEIFEYSQEKTVTITDLVSGMRRTMKSINIFAGRSDFLGGKTGYTDDARENLISLFKDGDRRWLIVVLGSSDRFGETLRLLSWAKKQ
ncbi:MAG: hypothetical protein COU10_00530 [Candidatus Harrisonbacteria bacterium CG10_big_fil_rev_8_21_14_0_10_45_28]|uniref:Peptidase S11 D-alanyl-D-alanine carboxypeptidase A N-terminal domain-containing protein n=1 Tax=Candidatus Harrisonbacteria bacterium CG10_big_fil_rev_8_21_14_0_10_45_28 TaxID=1974586 RepID=A0A2H0UP60_9BACT|nr:MAG: hypothetical protein COU10_00530 [Candidatus Harrisonbacteria bacterium CG10_big_fil_rev_8_21_14_0_10_45_28]